jgi:hypothetical protein
MSAYQPTKPSPSPGRNLDGSASSFVMETRTAQYGSSTISSGTAIMSRSTSGVLAPGVSVTNVASRMSQGGESAPPSSSAVGGVLAPCAEECPGGSPPRLSVARQNPDDSEAAAYTSGGVVGGARGGGDNSPAAAVAAASVSFKSGKDPVGRPSALWMPLDITLKVAQSSPSGGTTTLSERERLLQFGDACTSPPLQGKAAGAQQQQEAAPKASAVDRPLTAFAAAAACPTSSPFRHARFRDAAGSAAAEAGSSSGNVVESFPPPLRPAATLPLPGGAGLPPTMHRSPSLASAVASRRGAATAAQPSPFVGLSTSQLELNGHGRLMPAFMAAASSVGGGSGAASRADAPPSVVPNLAIAGSASASINASCQLVPELSMQVGCYELGVYHTRTAPNYLRAYLFAMTHFLKTYEVSDNIRFTRNQFGAHVTRAPDPLAPAMYEPSLTRPSPPVHLVSPSVYLLQGWHVTADPSILSSGLAGECARREEERVGMTIPEACTSTALEWFAVNRCTYKGKGTG